MIARPAIPTPAPDANPIHARDLSAERDVLASNAGTGIADVALRNQFVGRSQMFDAVPSPSASDHTFPPPVIAPQRHCSKGRAWFSDVN